MKSYYFKFVLNSLKSRRIRSWLTMIGIFIGIAAVVALIGLGEGLRSAINSQFGFLGTDILSVTASGGFGPPGTGVVDPLTDKELDAARTVSGVEGAAGRILESGKIKFNKKVGFGYAASMADREERDILEHILNMETARGRLLEDKDSGNVVLGYDFYEGSETFGKPIDVGDSIHFLDKEFEVIGILEKKGNFQIDRTVFMNEDDLREVVGREDGEYDIIGVRITENADMEKIQKSIEKEIRKIRDVDEGEEDFSVETPANTVESVNSILLGVQVFVYVIASISLLVGGIGIMNTMYTAVVERKKDIGIMKSIGAKNSTIFILFFIESGLLGAVGGIIGAALGFGMAKGLAFIGKIALGSNLISAQISPQLIIGALLFSFAVGSFFGTLPAVQASKLNPVDALRQGK